MVWGWKGIAQTCGIILGWEPHWRTVITWAQQEQDPLPVEVFKHNGAARGRVYANSECIEKWLARRRKPH